MRAIVTRCARVTSMSPVTPSTGLANGTGAGGFRVRGGVMLGDARAVGAAEQIDALVAERLAHRVEVAHGDARGVELRAARQLREASAGEVAQFGGRELAGLERLVRHGAIEPVRAACAALVHEHQVAFAMDAGEGA